MKTYEELVAEAVAAPLTGRDLKYLDGRMLEAEPPWSYRTRADELVGGTDGPVLDMSAGDGVLSARALPGRDGEYAVVLNRHDAFRAAEVRRVLRGDGVFLTEQVGGLDGLAINEVLGAPPPSGPADWGLSAARSELEDAGLRVVAGRSAFPERLFYDVGAVVYFLRATPHRVPDFSVERYDEELRLLHEGMSAEPFRDRAVRFLIEARPA